MCLHVDASLVFVNVFILSKNKRTIDRVKMTSLAVRSSTLNKNDETKKNYETRYAVLKLPPTNIFTGKQGSGVCLLLPIQCEISIFYRDSPSEF